MNPTHNTLAGKVEETQFSVYVTMPTGSTLEATDLVVAEVETRLEEIKEKEDWERNLVGVNARHVEELEEVRKRVGDMRTKFETQKELTEEKLKIIDRELIKRSGTYIEQAEMNMFPSDDSLKEMADGQAEMLRNDKCSDDSSPCCCICLEEYDESSIVTRPKVRYISIHFDAVYNSIS